MAKPIGIFYEHPEWFKKLFQRLDERGLPYKKLHAGFHQFNPLDTERKYSVVLNRISSSAYLRGHGQGIFYSKAFIAYLEQNGTRVINGSRATEVETSKALQLLLLSKLGLRFPKTVIVNHSSQILSAASQLQFPIAVKPNIGGAGAGIIRFNTLQSLEEAIDNNSINLGIDEIALVQEFIPARGGHINRVETLNGKFLYAIKVFTSGESFNLCPAEICAVPEKPQEIGEVCLTTAASRGIKVEAFTPPASVIESVERIVMEARIDVGGIEYIVDDRNGDILFYDINALSNFIADAENVIGFDPFNSLVDYLESFVNQTPVLSNK
jgi:glutathione synthase/RimK-type ligase-like ATP-grasp enzyme